MQMMTRFQVLELKTITYLELLWSYNIHFKSGNDYAFISYSNNLYLMITFEFESLAIRQYFVKAVSEWLIFHKSSVYRTAYNPFTEVISTTCIK